MASRLVWVNSYDRSSTSTSSTDFKVEHDGNIPPGLYKLLSIQIPTRIFNVNASNKNIPVEEKAVEYTATLTEGQYTGAALATEIGTALDAATPANDYSATYSTSTLKFTISSDDAEATILDWSRGIADSAYRLLGFAEATDTADFDNGSVVSTYTADIDAPRYLSFKIDESKTYMFDTKSSYNSFTIPYGAIYDTGLYVYEPPSNTNMLIEIPQKNELAIKLMYESTNHAVDLENRDWNFLLERVKT